MLSSFLDVILPLFNTQSPPKLFPSECITLYIAFHKEFSDVNEYIKKILSPALVAPPPKKNVLCSTFFLCIYV